MSKSPNTLFGNSPSKDKKKPITADGFAMKCARQLQKGLRKHGLLTMLPNLKKNWAPHFETLAKDHSEEEINKALDWLVSNIGDKTKRLKKYASAERFCYGFNLLVDDMDKDPGTVVMSEDGKQLYSKLSKLKWPRGLEKSLAGTIQRSLEHYTKFQSEAIDLVRMGALKPPELRLLQYLIDQYFSHPYTFIDGWMMRIHDSIGNFKQWNGSTAGLVFDVYGERFSKLVEGWTVDFCADWERWPRLLLHFKGGGITNVRPE